MRSNLARSRATAMSCQSSGVVQSYPVPVCGPAQPSKPNPAWGLNAQNHSKCILVIAALALPTVSLRCVRDHGGAVVIGIRHVEVWSRDARYTGLSRAVRYHETGA